MTASAQYRVDSRGGYRQVRKYEGDTLVLTLAVFGDDKSAQLLVDELNRAHAAGVAEGRSKAAKDAREYVNDDPSINASDVVEYLS